MSSAGTETLIYELDNPLSEIKNDAAVFHKEDGLIYLLEMHTKRNIDYSLIT